jgi:hypothetical protein
MGAQGLNEDMLVRVERIIQHLQIPLSDEIKMYIKQQEPSDIMVLPRSRTMARLHLHLFNSAVMIYLFCIVLRYTPSAVAEYVKEVLANSMTFFGMHCGSVSIWPVFMTAERQCDPGEVFVDWRDVMKRLDVDVLLL